MPVVFQRTHVCWRLPQQLSETDARRVVLQARWHRPICLPAHRRSRLSTSISGWRHTLVRSKRYGPLHGKTLPWTLTANRPSEPSQQADAPSAQDQQSLRLSSRSRLSDDCFSSPHPHPRQICTPKLGTRPRRELAQLLIRIETPRKENARRVFGVEESKDCLVGLRGVLVRSEAERATTASLALALRPSRRRRADKRQPGTLPLSPVRIFL